MSESERLQEARRFYAECWCHFDAAQREATMWAAEAKTWADEAKRAGSELMDAQAAELRGEPCPTP